MQAIDFTKPILNISVLSATEVVSHRQYVEDVEAYLKNLREDLIGGRLVEAELIRDIDRLYLLGYFEEISVQTVPYRNGIELQFIVTPNPILKKVDFNGESIFTSDELSRPLYHKPGVVFNSKYFKEDIAYIKDQYQSYGYELFQIEESHLDSQNNLVFKLNEGKVRSIRWNGLSRVQSYILDRQFRTQPGTVLNSFFLRKDREMLLKLGYFSNVSPPRLEETLDRTEVDIVFDVTEMQSNRVGLGLELEQVENEVVGFFRGDLSHVLIHSDLLSGKTQLGHKDGEIDVRTYSLHYYQPWFLNWIPLSFETNAWWTTQEERISVDLDSSFENTRIGADIVFGLPLFYDRLHFRTRFLIESVSPNVFLDKYNFEKYGVQSISFQIQYTDLEDMFNPRGGIKWLIRAERSMDLGEFENPLIFSRYRFDASTYFGLSERSVLGVHMGLGYFITDQDITTFEREKFELGGAATLRGFKEHRAFVGDRRFLLNLEYRWDVTDSIQWVVFYDVGTTLDYGLDITFDSFHHGRGIGIRFFTPLGPLRFDLAQGVEAGGEIHDLILHFSLGQLF